MTGYRIEKADSPANYQGLRDLWCKVFGDEREFIDGLYDIFGDEVSGYVMLDESGKVVSALTCYLCGELEGRPVYVSYAICTEPEYRGQGLAGKLTTYIKDKVTAEGGISIVSPASESLHAFYGALGYTKSCFARTVTVNAEDDGQEDFILGEDDDFTAFEPEFRAECVDEAEYNRYREEFLGGIAHVKLSSRMLEVIRSDSRDGNGLVVINGGDAVCTLAEPGKAWEFIVNPRLAELSEEIGLEIAASVAAREETGSLTFRMPATDDPDGRALQSMAAGSSAEEFYFGFPLD